MYLFEGVQKTSVGKLKSHSLHSYIHCQFSVGNAFVEKKAFKLSNYDIGYCIFKRVSYFFVRHSTVYFQCEIVFRPDRSSDIVVSTSDCHTRAAEFDPRL